MKNIHIPFVFLDIRTTLEIINFLEENLDLAKICRTLATLTFSAFFDLVQLHEMFVKSLILIVYALQDFHGDGSNIHGWTGAAENILGSLLVGDHLEFSDGCVYEHIHPIRQIAIGASRTYVLWVQEEEGQQISETCPYLLGSSGGCNERHFICLNRWFNLEISVNTEMRM
ncbi:hypothetical protein B0H19DRAFT_1059957 [Mycena capillaripes]|nr:hypothetical protein B0H19DRAFT_1059957 [Mycena capillaripes]